MTLETANREQVGRALDLARDGLRPFVERHLRRTRGGLGQIPAILRDTPYEEKPDPLSDIAVIVMVVRAAWERVLELHGRVRPYFSRNPDDLLTPAQVTRSGICVETKLGAPGVVERCEQVIELCGFNPREFGVETR